jgi:hypothetical protein
MGDPIVTPLFVIVGVLNGVLGSVFVLSLALYVLCEAWNINGWVALMICGAGAAFASIAIAPGFLVVFGGAQVASIGTFYESLIFLTHTLYGCCAGYWLFQSSTTELAHP